MSEERTKLIPSAGSARWKSIERRLKKLSDDMEEEGLALFSGHSGNNARLIHEETGIVIADIGGNIWNGGDPVYRWHGDIEWTPDISRTAGDFRQNTED